MQFFFAFLAVAALIGSLVLVYRRKARGLNPTKSLMFQIGGFFAFIALISVAGFTGSALAAEGDVASSVEGWKYLAAALSTGIAGIGGGIGVSGSASAAIGAVSENDSMFGKALIFVALAEGIALYGLLISFLILFS